MLGQGRADLHMHTTFSDGWPAPQELVDYASKTELDVIAVTDHDTIEGAMRAREDAQGKRVHVVVGEEVSSRNGHIVGLFLERRIRPGMSAAATVDAIHEQGGLAVAVHPFWRTERPSRRITHGVGWLAAETDFDAVEVENATPGFYVFNQMARRLNDGLESAEVGGSDAHILDAVGRAYTVFPGRTPAALREAIIRGTTMARRQRYKAVGLMRYAAWGLNHERYVAAAQA